MAVSHGAQAGVPQARSPWDCCSFGGLVGSGREGDGWDICGEAVAAPGGHLTGRNSALLLVVVGDCRERPVAWPLARLPGRSLTTAPWTGPRGSHTLPRRRPERGAGFLGRVEPSRFGGEMTNSCGMTRPARSRRSSGSANRTASVAPCCGKRRWCPGCRRKQPHTHRVGPAGLRTQESEPPGPAAGGPDEVHFTLFCSTRSSTA